MQLTIATYIMGIIFLLTGMLSLIAAIVGWNWFFKSASARMITGRMTKKAARCVYMVVGLLIVAMAVYLLINAE